MGNKISCLQLAVLASHLARVEVKERSLGKCHSEEWAEGGGQGGEAAARILTQVWNRT